jgi:cobalt/nickel transport system permease protein
MIDDWVGHYHRQRDNVLTRARAEIKLGLALVLIVGTVLLPPSQRSWFLGVGALLMLAIILGGIPLIFLLKRLAWLSPLILSVAVLKALQPTAGANGWGVALKSLLCLLTVIVVSNTTPFSQILQVLKRAHVPGLLITTIALMHRYLFVLANEAERMRRARASRTFVHRKGIGWQTLATVIAQLFVRASERAERIYDAMCARGWK